MSNDVIKAAVGFRLGCRLCEPHLCRCGALVDAYGTHSLACNEVLQQDANYAIHLINDIIYRSLARANIHSSREPLGCTDQTAEDRMGSPWTPWRAGKCLIWDATSLDTQAASHINGTSQKAGAAAEHRLPIRNDNIESWRQNISSFRLPWRRSDQSTQMVRTFLSD